MVEHLAEEVPNALRHCGRDAVDAISLAFHRLLDQALGRERFAERLSAFFSVPPRASKDSCSTVQGQQSEADAKEGHGRRRVRNDDDDPRPVALSCRARLGAGRGARGGRVVAWMVCVSRATRGGVAREPVCARACESVMKCRRVVGTCKATAVFEPSSG